MSDISCHPGDLTTRNEFHNGKAQKKAKRWIDRDLSIGLTCKTIRAIVGRLSSLSPRSKPARWFSRLTARELRSCASQPLRSVQVRAEQLRSGGQEGPSMDPKHDPDDTLQVAPGATEGALAL